MKRRRIGGTLLAWAELLMEQPTRFKPVIKLETAKALGSTIPQPLRLRADEWIP